MTEESTRANSDSPPTTIQETERASTATSSPTDQTGETTTEDGIPLLHTFIGHIRAYSYPHIVSYQLK